MLVHCFGGLVNAERVPVRCGLSLSQVVCFVSVSVQVDVLYVCSNILTICILGMKVWLITFRFQVYNYKACLWLVSNSIFYLILLDSLNSLYSIHVQKIFVLWFEFDSGINEYNKSSTLSNGIRLVYATKYWCVNLLYNIFH